MINRSNYEEYLLLYIDGELSPADKARVDAFLEANPDLRKELELLRQTVLQPEAQIRFEHRQGLYREEAGINSTNYQEFFLLYVDGELDLSAQASVETFVLQNPQLQDEFTLLKQAVLPADQVVFENKNSLYRKEEKRKPVVISLLRVSVAAAVLAGIVALLWILDPGTKTDPVAGTPQGTTPADNAPGGVTPPVKSPAVAVAEEKTPGPKPQLVTPAIRKQDVKQFAVEIPKENEQAPLVAHVTEVPNSNKLSQGTTVDPENNTNPDNTPQHMGTAGINPAPVQTTGYAEELEVEDDKTLYVGALEINPDKVRGFFRKAGRLLSGKKNNDETGGKVQVANLEFNKLK